MGIDGAAAFLKYIKTIENDVVDQLAGRKKQQERKMKREGDREKKKDKIEKEEEHDRPGTLSWEGKLNREK